MVGVDRVVELRDREHAHRGDGDHDPGGHGLAEHATQEALADAQIVRFEGEEERRYADREPAEYREVDGAQRIGEREHAGEDGQDHRVGGLGEEEAGDAFDVVDDAPTLTDHCRECREVRVHQHQLRDAPSCFAARCHRDAAVTVLQREHVVHAVAGHRDRVTAGLQRLHHRPLLVRSDAAEHGAVLDCIGELLAAVGRQRRRVHVVLPAGQSGAAGDGADGDVVVATDHLHGDALVGEVLQCGRRVGAYDVLQQHEGHRVNRRQRRIVAVRERAGGRGEDEYPLALRRVGLHLVLQVAGVGGGQHVLGRTEDPAAVIGE